MGRRSNSIVGCVVLAAVALFGSAAGAATLVDRARLREGPSKDTKLLGWVEAGTAVTIEGVKSGWYAIRAPDGQAGYIWQEHLRIDSQEAAQAPAVAATPPSTSATPSTLASSPPAVAPAVVSPPTLPPPPPAAAVERGDASIAGELERLRGEVGRLTAAQQELVQRLGRGERSSGGAPPAPLGSDGSTGAAVLFFGGGVVFGWLLGRFGPGRENRRSRLRL